MNLIEWYYKSNDISDEERKVLLSLRQIPILDDCTRDEKRSLTKQWLSIIPYHNINEQDYKLTFDETATTIINKVFEKEVDDDTLVITSYSEHPSVEEVITHYKNVERIDIYVNDLKKELKRIKSIKEFKKVFVYIIGTEVGTGVITPQYVFEQIIEFLRQNNCEYKLMIDDVHGLFTVPRDYSIFDYILCTAHSLVPKYNMGILFSKSGDIGICSKACSEDYLPRLEITLRNKVNFQVFKNIIYEYLYDLLADKEQFRLYDYTSNHIFAVRVKNIDLWKYKEELFQFYFEINKRQVVDENIFMNIKIRYQEFIAIGFENAMNGLKTLRKILEIEQFKKECTE